MKKSYPFVKCLHPRQITNRYTGEKVIVSCGHCHACLLNRYQKMSMLCSQEEQSHSYCYFVTLTYDMKHLPMMSLEKSDMPNEWLVRDDYKESPTFGKYIGRFYMQAGKLSLFLRKVQRHWRGYEKLFPRSVCYASRVDFTKFMKRLRKRIYKRTHETIRYYAVSEYGPATFRPHFHCLLYFDDPQTLQGLQKDLSESWTLGRVDSSLSRGKCSSYVAKYVNSFVSLPQVFANCTSHPFSSHSNFFATQFYKGKRKEVYEMQPEQFVRQRRCISGRIVEFTPWRSFTSCFYPKCREYNSKSFYELYFSYSILRVAKEVYGDKKVSEIARLIYCDLQSDYLDDILMHSGIDDVTRAKLMKHIDVLRYFNPIYQRYCNLECECIIAISSDLYVSNHLYTFCLGYGSVQSWFVKYNKNKNAYKEEVMMIRSIVAFYEYYDKWLLKEMYKSIEEFQEQQGDRFVPQVVNYLYNNSFSSDDIYFDFPKLAIYKEYVSEVENEVRNSIKHKKLNDMNLIFCNE